MIVEVPELALDTVTEVGEALRVKLALAGAVTVRADRGRLRNGSMRPVPAVTVIGYVPVAVVEATVMVMVELPDPAWRWTWD